jgi:hypothetical protein
VLGGVTFGGTAGTGATYDVSVGRGAGAGGCVGVCNGATLVSYVGITVGGSVEVCDGCTLGSGVGGIDGDVGGTCVGMDVAGVLVGSMVVMMYG